MNGTVTSVTIISEINFNLTQLELVIDDFSTYTLFGDYKLCIEFIGKDVEFEVRPDVISGIQKEVICNIAVTSIIQSIKDDEDIVDGQITLEDLAPNSLIPDTSSIINVITFDKNLLKSGDIAKSQIILVTGYKFGKSKFAKWTDFICLDVNSRVFNLRLFSNDDNVEEFCKNIIGHYVMVDIKNENKYGLQVLTDMQIYEHEVQLPPEVYLSTVTLKTCIAQDTELREYIKKYDVFEYLKSTIYFEPGYHLVEMAAEIMLIKTICKIFGGYDKKLLYRAVFASRGYLLGTNINLSNPIVNYHRVITSSLKQDYDLIRLLDITNGVGEGDLNKQIYLSVRKQVTSIMKGRRGINEANKFNVMFNTIDNEFSGVFQRGILELD